MFNCLSSPQAPKSSIFLQQTVWSGLSQQYTPLPGTDFCLGHCSITVKGHFDKGKSYKKERHSNFRGLVHFNHGREHGGTEAGTGVGAESTTP